MTHYRRPVVAGQRSSIHIKQKPARNFERVINIKNPLQKKERSLAYLRRFFLLAHLPAGGALAQHFICNGRLFESRSAFEFLQNASSLVFFLKAPERPIDRFVFLYDNSYHSGFFSFLLKLVGRFNGIDLF
jgi:hypothetical protein